VSFRAVLKDELLWEGEMTRVEADGMAVLLVRVDGRVYAYRDACEHKGMPLSQGSLDGRLLTCGAHHWCYDVVSGRGVNPESTCLRRVPVRVSGDTIEIDAAARSQTLP